MKRAAGEGESVCRGNAVRRSGTCPGAPGSDHVFGKKQSLVGLDIGSHTVKVAEMESQSNKSHKLVNWGISPPLGEAIVDGEIMDRQLVIDAIGNLLETRGIQTKSVVAAVSGRAVIVKRITMNRLSQEDASRRSNWEAEQHVPYDINDVSLDFEILGPAPNDPKQMQVLLVAAKKDMVLSFSDLIREAGLEPLIVDVDSFAAQNALEANYNFLPEEVVATLNIGAEITNINITQGGVPYFTKDVQLGGHTLIETAQRKFNLSQSEAGAAVRGEATSSVDIAPLDRAGVRRARDRARARAGLSAHRRRGRRDLARSCSAAARAHARAAGVPEPAIRRSGRNRQSTLAHQPTSPCCSRGRTS